MSLRVCRAEQLGSVSEVSERACPSLHFESTTQMLKPKGPSSKRGFSMVRL